MKKVNQFYFIFCFLFIVNSLFAQVVVGFRAGVNFSSASILNKDAPQKILLFTFGIPIQIRLNEHFYAQSGLDFVQKGFKYSNASSATTSNWVETSFLGKYKLGGNKPTHGFLIFGPSLGFRIGGRGQFDSSYDFGLNIGGQLMLKNMFFDLRYQHGFTDLDTYDHPSRQSEIFSRGIALTVGFFQLSKNKAATVIP
jgi:hypothetical protein